MAKVEENNGHLSLVENSERVLVTEAPNLMVKYVEI